MGARNMAMKNIAAVNTEERPVRPPSAMPAEDSTKVVTVDVPQTAPKQVAAASAKHGLVHIGNIAVLIKQVADGACTVKSAESIEHINHAEGKHGSDERCNKAANAVGRDVCGEVKAFGEILCRRKC